MIKEPAHLMALMTVVIAVSYILVNNLKWLSRIGCVMIIIVAGMLLSNFGVIANRSPVYEITFRHIIPLSISLLLLRLNFRDLKQIDRRLVVYFILGAVGTVAGVFMAFLLFGNLIGDEAWKLAGQITASYIGGGENAVAVGATLDVSKNLFTAAFASDNIITTLWMMVCLASPVIFRKFLPARATEATPDTGNIESKRLLPADILPSVFYSLTISGLVVVASDVAAKYVSFIPNIIWVTTFSLIIAQTGLHKHIQISYVIGTFLFNYFFFTLGAISSVKDVIMLGPKVFVFVATVVVVHAIFIIGGGKLFKADLPKLFTASQALIGGPSTACALAEANNWPHLVLPGILMGVLGYAVANYLGIAIAFLLH